MAYNEYKEPSYINGLKAGIPIALGYFVVSFTFGMSGALMGIKPFELLFMSMTNLTSAGQFAGANIIANGGTYLEIAITQLVINIRYLLMSTAISQKINKLPLSQRLIMAIGVTDEIFSVSMVEVETITFKYFMGATTLPFIGWSIGTLLGSVLDNIMSPALQASASIALYCMFIALVIPPSKHYKDIRMVCIITCIIRVVMVIIPYVNKLSGGYSVVIAAIIASIIGTFVFPEKSRYQE